MPLFSETPMLGSDFQVRYTGLREVPLRDLKEFGAKGPMWVVVKIIGPFLGTLNNRCRTIIWTQKREHNLDNRPCTSMVNVLEFST